jgi:hypothetical protein
MKGDGVKNLSSTPQAPIRLALALDSRFRGNDDEK